MNDTVKQAIHPTLGVPLFNADGTPMAFKPRFDFDSPLMQKLDANLKKITIAKTDDEIYISRGESIITENSYKFTESEIKLMVSNSGLKISDIWYDKKKFYSLILAQKN